MRSFLKTPAFKGIILFLLFLQFQNKIFGQSPNDLCANATLLTSGTTCVNTAGHLRLGGIPSLPTAGIAVNCGNASSMDVWYRFVAQTAYPTITLSSVGANFVTAGPRIQLFSGACAGLTSL